MASPDAAGTDEGPSPRRKPWGHPLLIAALTGVIGLLGGLGAAQLQIEGTVKTQAAQLSAQAAKDARTKRADVYFSFLDAADQYAVATKDVHDCINAVTAAAKKSGKDAAPGKACFTDFNNLASARFKFQSQRNQVYVYGSDAAEVQATLIASSLPDALGTDAPNGIPPIDGRVTNFDPAAFGRLYQNFETVMCQELPAEPRGDC